jgi:hypothetical protein
VDSAGNGSIMPSGSAVNVVVIMPNQYPLRASPNNRLGGGRTSAGENPDFGPKDFHTADRHY